VGRKVEDEVTQSQDSGPQERGDPVERDPLPEVRDLMQRITSEHDVRRLTVVDVGKEFGVHHRDVVEREALDARAERCRHGGRHVDRDDSTARRRHGNRECSRSGSEVDDHRVGAQAMATENVDVIGRIERRLTVVASHVSGIEVLGTCVRLLVQPPAPHRPTPPLGPRHAGTTLAASRRLNRRRQAREPR
jgi:hypothetical protein